MPLICTKCYATYPIQLMDELQGRCRCGNQLRYVENWEETPRDFLIEEKDVPVEIDEKVREWMAVECIFLLLMAFIWVMTPMFSGLNYFMGVLFMVCGVLILYFSYNETFNDYLRLLYYGASFTGALAFIVCISLIIYAVNNFDINFFWNFEKATIPGSASPPPLYHPMGVGLISIFTSLWMLIRGTEIK